MRCGGNKGSVGGLEKSFEKNRKSFPEIDYLILVDLNHEVIIHQGAQYMETAESYIVGCLHNRFKLMMIFDTGRVCVCVCGVWCVCVCVCVEA